MIYLFGNSVSDTRQVFLALKDIYGIGLYRAQNICAQIGVSNNCRIKDLSEDTIGKMCKLIEQQYRIEGNLKKEIIADIKRLRMISCYRGIRHAHGLPVRGQRTHTNSRTSRFLSKRYQ